MIEGKTEAVILKSFDYQEKTRILNAFSKTDGLITFMLKGTKNAPLLALSSPLCRIEAVFIKGRSHLFKLKEASILDLHLFLRDQFSFLQTAGELVRIILKTQMAEHPAPKLYALFLAFLRKIPEFEDPFLLITAFHLKVLMHEGVLSWRNPEHFPISVDTEEWELLKKIGTSLSFEKIKNYPFPKGLKEKIEAAQAKEFAKGGTRTHTSCPTTTSK